ncbi:hypothetical protein M3Y94_00845200 [Aphelenchoides besseyi]|nr:hypothetical protein M3Y94_00845200 [Aphelenchoides besseyi]
MLLHSGLLLILLNQLTTAFECFRTAGDGNNDVQYCNPDMQPLCLRAVAFDEKNIQRLCNAGTVSSRIKCLCFNNLR